MGNLRMNADQISYKGGEKPMSVEEAIKNAGNTGLAHTADIAPDFSAESAYNAGDLVYHNGTLYVFTSNHAAGAWSTSDTQAVTVGGEITSLKSGLTNLLKYKVCNDVASDTTSHLYSTGVPVSNYVCVGGCTPNNPNYCVEISNIEVASGGNIRYRLYDVATNQVVSDNAAYLVYLVFVDTSMLSELVLTP